MKLNNKKNEAINPATAEGIAAIVDALGGQLDPAGYLGLTNTQLRATNVPVTMKDAAGIESRDMIVVVKSSITLPANQNAYAAGDVVANATLSLFVNVAKAAGRGVILIGTRIQVTEASLLGGKTFNLHLFNDTIAAIADNAAFVISDANTDKREGFVAVTMGNGNRVKVGHNNTDQIAMVPVARNIPFILETVEGWTPAANSGVINIYTKWLIQ